MIDNIFRIKIALQRGKSNVTCASCPETDAGFYKAQIFLMGRCINSKKKDYDLKSDEYNDGISFPNTG